MRFRELGVCGDGEADRSQVPLIWMNELADHRIVTGEDRASDVGGAFTGLIPTYTTRWDAT
jgi:hypothetical protein